MQLDVAAVRIPRQLFVDRGDLLDRIKLSINDFSTIFADMEMEHVSHDEEHVRLDGAITGIVSFEGAYKGLVWARCSESFAALMANRLKSAEEELLDNHAREAVGEMVNILGGELRLFLSPGGRRIELSSPSVFKGNELDSSGFETTPTHLCCTFQHGLERLHVGVVLRNWNCKQIA
jgi:CheY-specific phosphatase CheX